MRKLFRIGILFIIFGLSWGADWYVHPDGSAAPDGSIDHPFSSIQQALDAAQSGDRIFLQPGIYSGSGNINLDPNGKLLTIQSIEPEKLEIIATTIIDPNGLGRGFIFQNNEGPEFVLQGLTIRNAFCKQEDEIPHGAGIFCSQAGPRIRFCIFENCDADGGWGGAFYGEESNASFEHCLFTGNRGRYGGAAAVNLGSTVSFNHCTLAGNTALFAGGGIVADFESVIALRNSIVFFNDVESPNGNGFQIELRSSSLTAAYTNISNQPGDIETDEDSFVLFEEGILNVDPSFAFFIPQSPLNQRDFHLKSRFGRWDPHTSRWVQDPSTSPCIDAGDPNVPWQAEPWPNGKRVNLGFYGATAQASLYGNPADFNLDGIVDLFDLSELIEKWLSSPSIPDFYDLSMDGGIDIEDFNKFSRYWLRKSKNSADFDRDGDVDESDFSLFSEMWLGEGDFQQDLNLDGVVDLNDLELFIQEWLWKI